MALDVTTIGLPLPLGMGWVNCFLIRADGSYVLIDTGGANARRRLSSELEAAGCSPGGLRLVILTHGDFDHIGNAAYLRSLFRTRVAIHRFDAAMAERGDMFASRNRPNAIIRGLMPILSGYGRAERFTADILLEDEQNLSEHGLEARVISLPGHSRGSIGVLTAGGELFCGDLFENTKAPGVGSLMDDPEAARASVASLAAWQIRIIYPGHGQPFAWDALVSAGI